MNIQQFKYVLAVLDSKNFQSAAEKCFVTQSTLSTMLNKFESEIGIKIFNRKTKPVSITTEGELLINKIRVIVNEIEELKSVVKEIKGEVSGNLKLAIIPTIAPYILPVIINSFEKKFPDVNIVLKEMTTDQIKQNLLLRNIDIGILALPIKHKELNEYPLYDEPFFILDCDTNYSKTKMSPLDIDYSRMCLLEDGHCLKTQVYDICKLSESKLSNSVNYRFESGSMESLIRITEARKGVTLLPYLATKFLTEDLQKHMIDFSYPIPIRNVGLLTHNFFAKKKLLELLIAIIKDNVANLIPEIKNTKLIKPL